MPIFAGVDPTVQKLVLRISTTWHRFFPHGRRTQWVVGPVEVAGLVRAITEALPSAQSVLLQRHSFYGHEYDWVARPARTHLGEIVQGPWKLGALLARSSGFVYLSGAGFLNHVDDGREFEFKYLRARAKHIVCYFTGDDIRSPRLSAEQELRTGEPNLATYLVELGGVFATEAYESQKRAIAASAESNANLIFNADVGQRGYLTRPSEPFLYFHPDAAITEDFSKYRDLGMPVIVHAPSSPIVKGTQLVRAAIAELRDEGYRFDYVELVRRSHNEVQASLSRAHIVLNQFYSEVPGVFGVEALAAGCVVLMRADEHDEPMLPTGSNEAWVVTRHHQVTKHLRALLDDPGAWEDQARAGVEWVRTHAAMEVTGKVFREKLAALTAPVPARLGEGP